MVYYGVLKPASGGFEGVLNKDTGDLDTARLDGATGEITALTKDFDERAAKKDSVDPITLTGLLDPAQANDGQPYESEVEQNIRESFRAFHDGDADGAAD